MKVRNYLIITHTTFHNGNPAAGPYSSVIRAFVKDDKTLIESVKLPLIGYTNPILYGNESLTPRVIKIPQALGKIAPLKYLTDILITSVLLIRFYDLYKKDIVVIGVDPLSTLPAIFFKKILGYKLIFYSVDFNEKRFKNFALQKMYEIADELSSRYSDQVWVVCDSLKEYKKTRYGVSAIYIPNSFPFDGSYYEKNKTKRTANKVVWTGSILVEQQINHMFRLCKEIQKLRPDMEFWFIPSNKIDLFYKAIKEVDLKQAQVFNVSGQEESRNLVAQCDVGIAIYDREFGSTKYIEPIKIWEYMMCGLPFIISCEPSLNPEVKKSGVMLFLNPNNAIPEGNELKEFIVPQNLKEQTRKCLKLAQKYDAKNLMATALEKLSV